MRFHAAVLMGLLMAGDAGAALPAGSEMPSLAPMLEQVTPSVVNIATYTTVQVRNPLMDDPFFRRFFNIPEQQQRYRRTKAAGSGVIVDARQGYIVTNNHVIEDASRITVSLLSGERYRGTVVGVDRETDIALVKIDADHALPVMKFGDSNAVQVGDWVLAIGSPLGLDLRIIFS